MKRLILHYPKIPTHFLIKMAEHAEIMQKNFQPGASEALCFELAKRLKEAEEANSWKSIFDKLPTKDLEAYDVIIGYPCGGSSVNCAIFRMSDKSWEIMIDKHHFKDAEVRAWKERSKLWIGMDSYDESCVSEFEKCEKISFKNF